MLIHLGLLRLPSQLSCIDFAKHLVHRLQSGHFLGDGFAHPFIEYSELISPDVFLAPITFVG